MSMHLKDGNKELPKTAEAIGLVDPEKQLAVEVAASGHGTRWEIVLHSKHPRTRADVRRVVTAFLADLTEQPMFEHLDKPCPMHGMAKPSANEVN